MLNIQEVGDASTKFKSIMMKPPKTEQEDGHAMSSFISACKRGDCETDQLWQLNKLTYDVRGKKEQKADFQELYLLIQQHKYKDLFLNPATK